MRVNGEDAPTFEGTVQELLQHLGVHPRGVAVAINGVIVPRSMWVTTAVSDGDVIEIVTAAAGG
jgi:sulfur carrier protein